MDEVPRCYQYAGIEINHYFIWENFAMSKLKTYRIERISDLLSVPVDRREECVKEILMGLSLSELTGTSNFLSSIEWTDDGDSSSTIVDVNGDIMLKMEITPN